MFTLYIDSRSLSLQTHELLPMFCTAFVLFQRIIWTVELTNSFSCALQYLLPHALHWILHYHQLCSTALCINNANMERIAREERDMVISWREKYKRFVRSFPPMEKSTVHSTVQNVGGNRAIYHCVFSAVKICNERDSSPRTRIQGLWWSLLWICNVSDSNRFISLLPSRLI